MGGYKECKQCGTINQQDASHCLECGAPLGSGNKKLLYTLVFVGVALVSAAAVYLLLGALDDRGGSGFGDNSASGNGAGAGSGEPVILGDVQVDDVCGLRVAPDYELGEEVSRLVADQEVRYCQQGDLYVAFTYIRYNDGTPTSLDGAVDGSLAEMRASGDVQGLDCDVQPFTLDGRPARRASCTFTATQGDVPAATDIIYTMEGVEMYMVQAVFATEGDKYQDQVDQLMNSFGFVPGK